MRRILSRFPTSTLMGLAFTVPAMLIAGLLLFYHSMGARRFLADEGVRYGDMLADQLLSASQRFIRLGSLSAVQEMIEETGSRRSVLAVALIGRDGRVIASNKRDWIGGDQSVIPDPDFTAVAAAARATAQAQHRLVQGVAGFGLGSLRPEDAEQVVRRVIELQDMGFGWATLNATAIFQSGARSVDAMIEALRLLHDKIRKAV